MKLEQLLALSVKEKSSDLHLSPGLPPIIRIYGDLIHLKDQPVLSAETIQKMIYSVMTKAQQQVLENELELDFGILVPEIAGFRVNVFKQIKGLAVVFRVIPSHIPTLDDLNLPQTIKPLLEHTNGLILITGPTGSGKSTTLAAMIDHINANQAVHIITIEDPIEFTHQSKKSLISQRQLHRDTRSFAAALRSALREDPNVILLGEMRDLETIRLALTAAETGHLVMATLHTSSAPRTINRIVDVFPADEKDIIRNMLSESLQVIICQTLVKSTDGARVAAFEIMLGTPAIRNLIREDKVAQMTTTIQTNSGIGMCTLDQSLQQLLKNKLISQQEAHAAAINKSFFNK